MHTPVMLRECVEYLSIRPNGVYADLTCGLGGHSGAIARQLKSLGGVGRLIACDRDAESLEMAKANLADCADKIHFHQSVFSRVGDVLAAEGISQLDGLLADLGVSKYQLTDGGRGFSLMADGPLDMRMSRTGVSAGLSHIQRTAADIVNYESEKELADLIFRKGEERRSRKIARAIVRARPITTTGQLAKLIEGAVPRTSKLHPATQTFMALRLEVNQEMEELDSLLASLARWVKPNGRVVMLTFMSIEDRKVKQSFQALAKEGRATLLNRHVVKPTEEETRENPAARSAKLRAIEMN